MNLFNVKDTGHRSRNELNPNSDDDKAYDSWQSIDSWGAHCFDDDEGTSEYQKNKKSWNKYCTQDDHDVD